MEPVTVNVNRVGERPSSPESGGWFEVTGDLDNYRRMTREHAEITPVVSVPPPIDPPSNAQYMAKVKVMYDLVRLAFETDSTRAITLMLNSVATPVITLPGATITDSYHNLSHHGKTDEKLTQLKVLDEWHMKQLAELFRDLKAVNEGGETLLDRTDGERPHSIRDEMALTMDRGCGIYRTAEGMTATEVAELIGSSSGIGHMIIDSQALLATGQMIFGIIVIGLIGLASYFGYQPKAVAGLLHDVNEAYFERIAAMEYTIAHDDGVGWECRR